MKNQFVQVVAGVLAALVVCGVVLLARDALTRPAPVVARSDASSGLDTIVMHFDPLALDTVAPTYEAILDALPEARVRVAVERREDFETFVEVFGGRNAERMSPVVVGRKITTWSRDRYTLAARGEERVLLVPPQRDKLATTRANDWLVPFELARAEGAEVEIEDFDFDGGDIILGPSNAFADVNLLRKNPERFRTPAALQHKLETMLGRPIVVLGQEPGDVPHHHIGMYLTPLGDGSVAMGSPTLALDLLGGENSDAYQALAKRLGDAGMPAIDLTPETVARFDKPARQLEELGYEVVRLPLVPLDDKVTFITWNNGLTDASGEGAPRFLMPSYGLPTLDEAATTILEARGLKVVPIDVRRVFRHHGSVRCLVNVL